MKIDFKKLLPHLTVVILFILASLAYFNPVLQGKKIFQSDIVQYIGMSKERNDYKQTTGTESYWTNSAFGGMPTYQLGANYPHNYIKKLDSALRFLPRPADYLFLYFIGFYVLLLVLKADYKLAFIGSLAFGFSTYLIIILGVGHNAKAHAIGYFPLVLAGILMVFQRKYTWGMILTAVAMSLEIVANHFQMTYYLMLLVLIIGAVYLIEAIKNKEMAHFLKSVGLLTIAVLIAVSTNATNLLATKEYAGWSTRGKSELTVNADGTEKLSDNGLNKDYITEYSYGLGESLNLFVPRLYGGSNGEDLGVDSKTYKFLVNQGVQPSQAAGFVENLPTYWGDQPIVAAPAYIGAVVILLFALGLILVRGRLKWWLLGGTLLSLMLSWGKNFGFLTDLMIEYFPLYNKFRAVSSVQVILELCVPVLGVMGLSRLFDKEISKAEKLKAIKFSVAAVAGLGLVLLVMKGIFSFESANDAYYRQQFTQMGLPELMDIIILDRKAMYNQDLIRSIILVLIAAAGLWAFVAEKLKERYLIAVLGILIVFDLAGVDRRYVNKDDFVQARVLDRPFQPNTADTEILKDKGHFRVYEPSSGLSGARASYFHNAIGGYHAAKPGRFQELYDYQIANNNVGVLNMLNVRYIIQQNQNGIYAARNPFANGNAWFVKDLISVNSADEEMRALDSLDVRTEAVIDVSKFPVAKKEFILDSAATIKLETYAPDKLVYRSVNSNEGFAVFSEMYYPHGWKVSIDEQPADMVQVNYVLRALQVPAGDHTITFSFEPDVIATGSKISMLSSVLLLLLILGGLMYELKGKEDKAAE